jgi:glycosyltransferase involved in cell wall biosynthesis
MSYNGTILVPEYSVYPGYASNRYSLLFELIAQRNNFKVMATSSFKKEQQEGKICIAFKSLQHNDIHQNEQVLLLDNDISIIFYPVDLQHIDEPTLPEYRPLYERLLKKAVKIICPYKEAFIKAWGNNSETMEKFIWFPHSFGDKNVWNKHNNINNAKKNKCLSPGYAGLDYEMRRELLKYPEIADSIYHEEKYVENIVVNRKPFFGEEYVKKLNGYDCCFTCPSRFNYPLAKFFEIPAAGSLLVAKTCNDIKELGFIENVHYISVDEGNYINKIKEILKSPRNYDSIVKQGQDFVLEKFDIMNRVIQLEKIIGEIL